MGKTYARRSVADTAGVAELYVVPLFWRAARARCLPVICFGVSGRAALEWVANINMNTNINGG